MRLGRRLGGRIERTSEGNIAVLSVAMGGVVIYGRVVIIDGGPLMMIGKRASLSGGAAA